MKLDKAIELSPDIVKSLKTNKFMDYADAIQLGIEALKQIQKLRESSFHWAPRQLPGETPIDAPELSDDEKKNLRESPLGREPR